MRITLLEDDPAQAKMVSGWLEEAGHDVQHFADGRSLIDALPLGGFDLMVVDWELPDTTGLEVLGTIRKEVEWHVPVLFTTGRDSEQDIVAALNAGADDYMVKQISNAELLARINALSRRHTPLEREVTLGPYRFFPESRSVTLHGEEVPLTAKDFELAYHLFRNVGRLFSREQLLQDVWQVTGPNTRTVDVHVSRIRKRMSITPESGYRIKTIYQHGYRLEQL